MDLFGGWRSMSKKTMLFIALAAAYYLALNAVLIHEIIERVQMGPQFPVVAAVSYAPPVETLDPQDASASCSGLAKAERDICRVELPVGRASTRFREERRERRAVHDGRRATPAPSALTDAVHRESAATLQ